MSGPPRILVVEDDENLRLGLQDNLEEQGYIVVAVADAASARAALQATSTEAGRFQLIILDVMLPDGDGYSLCRELRARGERALVLMLTARTLEQDIVTGFDSGADDYVAKPYRIAELLARVRALLRRTGAWRDSGATFGDFRIDAGARLVQRVGGDAVELTRTEFDLLSFFLDHNGRALHRQTILDAVWGEDVNVEGHTVDNFVSSLKKKLQWTPDDPWRITTIRGVGYRFELEPPTR